MKRFSSISRHSFGVRNRAPWSAILGHSIQQFHESDLFTSAAAMSYFGLMALFPALLLMLSLSNRTSAGNQMLTRIVEVYPASAKFLRETIHSLSHVGTGVVITCFVIVLWAGSWVFSIVEGALNRIWGTTRRTFWHGRLITLGMIGIVGLLLSLSVLITSMVVALQEMATRLSPRQLEHYAVLPVLGSVVLQLTVAVVSIFVTVTLFVIVYRFMPKAEVTFRDAFPGAVVGGLLWEGAKYTFAASLNHFHYDEIYGPVGAVVAVLTWSYVSSLILLFGAQLTAVLHREHPL